MYRNYFRFIFLVLIFKIDIIFAEGIKLKAQDIYPQKSENCDLNKHSNMGCIVVNGDKHSFYLKGTEHYKKTFTEGSTMDKGIYSYYTLIAQKPKAIPLNSELELVFEGSLELKRKTSEFNYLTHSIAPGGKLEINIKNNTENKPVIIGDFGVGIASFAQTPLSVDLSYSYAQSSSLNIKFTPKDSSSKNQRNISFVDRIYFANGAKMDVDAQEGEIEWKAVMRSEFAYPKDTFYKGDAFDKESFLSENYKNATDEKDDIATLGQNVKIDFKGKSFSNTGELYTSGGAGVINIDLSGGNSSVKKEGNLFNNGSKDVADVLSKQNLLKTLNSNTSFSEQKGRISVFDYAKVNVKGNFSNNAEGSIVLIDGGMLDISGDFKNKGWILSGAINSKDYGYIKVSGKSTFSDGSQIGLISSYDNLLLGNRAYLVLKSEGGISFEGADKSEGIKNENLHLFFAKIKSGGLSEVSDEYAKSNLVFQTKLTEDKKEFYVTLTPSESAKSKSIEQLIKEAKKANERTELNQKMKQALAEGKLSDSWGRATMIGQIPYLAQVQAHKLPEAKIALYEQIIKNIPEGEDKTSQEKRLEAMKALYKGFKNSAYYSTGLESYVKAGRVYEYTLNEQAKRLIKLLESESQQLQKEEFPNLTQEAFENLKQKYKERIKTIQENIDEINKNYLEQRINYSDDRFNTALRPFSTAWSNSRKHYNDYKSKVEAMSEGEEKTKAEIQLAELKKAMDKATLEYLGDAKSGIPNMGTKLRIEYREAENKLADEAITNISKLFDELFFFNPYVLLAKAPKLEKRESLILDGIKNISDTLGVTLITYAGDIDTLKTISSNVENYLQNTAVSTKKSQTSLISDVVSQTTISNRLSMLSSPFANMNNDISFEALLKKASGKPYALETSLRNDSLNALEEELFNKEPKDKNMDIYATLIGGYAKGEGQSIFYGGNVGYDTFINDKVILGFYAGYTYANNKNGSDSDNSHNVNAAIYSRILIEKNEIDIGLGNNTAFISENKQMAVLNTNFSQESDYISNTSYASLSYGYAFRFDQEKGGAFILKPLIGISGGYRFNQGHTQKGIALEQKDSGVFFLNANAGLELRQYFKDGGYFYLIPQIDTQIYNTLNSLAYNIGGIEISMPLNQSRNIYYGLFAGGEFKISSSLYGFGSVGLKIADASNQYYNGTLGMRYKF